MPEKFEIKFPSSGGEEYQFDLKTGEMLFLLGGNGVGKSGLATYLFRTHRANAKRIAAHRQTWFSSNSLDITPSSRNELEETSRDLDSQVQARYSDWNPAQRAAISLFDLVDADNMLARKIADLVRDGEGEKAAEVAQAPAPIASINELMEASNIPITIEVQDRQKIVARKNDGPPFSVAELSDGERNAFLIAADVLTAKPGTLLIIDEPERHLHRSIISPLLTLLFNRRPDCAFVISTHELMLPVDNPEASSLLLRDCVYDGGDIQSWLVDLLPKDAPLDEALKIDVLGGRQRIVFVEGTSQSLDAPLYSLLFPQVSVIPKSNCRDVELAVRSLRDLEEMHWVKAWGIVDRDQRDEDDVEKLKEIGVFALSHYSVEALYYHPEIIARLAGKMACLLGRTEESLLDTATSAAVDQVLQQRDHFVLHAVEQRVRRHIFDSLPSKSEIADNPTVAIEVNVAEIRSAEEQRFDELIASADFGSLARHYPIRESNALASIANNIGFRRRADYEDAVRVLVGEDQSAFEFLLNQFGALVGEINGADSIADI